MENFLGTLVQLCFEEGGTLQTNITGMCGECSQCLRHIVFDPAHGMCAFPVYTAQALGCSVRNCLRWALSSMHFPGLSRSDSGTQVLFKGTNSVWPAFCALPGPSISGDQVLGERGRCDLSPPQSLLLGFLGVRLAHLLRCAVCLF